MLLLERMFANLRFANSIVCIFGQICRGTGHFGLFLHSGGRRALTFGEYIGQGCTGGARGNWVRSAKLVLRVEFPISGGGTH